MESTFPEMPSPHSTNLNTGNRCRLQFNVAWRTLVAAALICPGVPVHGQVPVVEINGASGTLEENIRAHLDINERCDSPQRRLDRLTPQVRRSIERAAQALGYYALQQTLAFDAGDPCWTLRVDLQVGPPVRFGEINIDIDAPTAERELFSDILTDPPIESGQLLDHSLYEALKSDLSATAISNGFFSARFNRSELRVDLQRNMADIDLDFTPGERYRFGDIRISPLPELSGEFVSRFIPFGEDTPYASEQLVELRQSLNESQYFSQISVTPEISRAQGQTIPVTIDLTPRPRRSYTTGVGFSTDVGPRLRFAYEDRYINRSGHRLNADIAVSEVQQEPNISYVIPMRDPAHESLRFSSGFLGEKTEVYESETFRLGATYRSRVWGEWIQNIFINFQSEKFDIIEQSERTNSTIPGINWSRTKSDDPIFPTRGWRLFAQVSGSSEHLLSSISFVQLYGSAKLIHSVGPGRLLLRAEAATTIVSELQELPASLRFFTGGDTSVRGYSYEEIGALNDQGEVIGGEHLLAASIEYDFPVRPGWTAAVFYDAGNSFANFEYMHLRRSVGAGLRWLSPIGPIRLDVARALDEGSFRLHVTMGPDL